MKYTMNTKHIFTLPDYELLWNLMHHVVKSKSVYNIQFVKADVVFRHVENETIVTITHDAVIVDLAAGDSTNGTYLTSQIFDQCIETAIDIEFTLTGKQLARLNSMCVPSKIGDIIGKLYTSAISRNVEVSLSQSDIRTLVANLAERDDKCDTTYEIIALLQNQL